MATSITNLADYVWPAKYIFESPSVASFRNNPGSSVGKIITAGFIMDDNASSETPHY